MRRGQLIRDMALGLLPKNATQTRIKKKETLKHSVPDYVEMFDKGRWEEFDTHLNLDLQRKTNIATRNKEKKLKEESSIKDSEDNDTPLDEVPDKLNGMISGEIIRDENIKEKITQREKKRNNTFIPIEAKEDGPRGIQECNTHEENLEKETNYEPIHGKRRRSTNVVRIIPNKSRKQNPTNNNLFKLGFESDENYPDDPGFSGTSYLEEKIKEGIESKRRNHHRKTKPTKFVFDGTDEDTSSDVYSPPESPLSSSGDEESRNITREAPQNNSCSMSLLSSNQNLLQETQISRKTVFNVDEVPQSNSLNTVIDKEMTCSVDLAKRNLNNKSKRVWDKRYKCCYCKGDFSKIARHFELKHRNELLVANFSALPKSSPERLKIITQLRSRGKFIQNQEVLQRGGTIVPKKRPHVNNKKPADFLPCEFCGDFYSNKELNNHQSRCVLAQSIPRSLSQKKGVRARAALLLPIVNNLGNSFQNEILQNMKQDEIFDVIIKDQLIIDFGNSLFNRYGHLIKHHRLIKDRLREVGRVLIEVKRLDKDVHSLQDLISPKKYSTFLQAVKNVTGFSPETNKVKIPSLAIKIGQSITKCATLLKADCFLDDILQLKLPDVDRFMFLMKSKWNEDITSKARTTLYENQWNKETVLPIASDIKKMHCYLLTEADRLQCDFERERKKETFEKLMKICLVRALVLNRRRVGETQFALVEDFKHNQSKEKESDIFSSLSETEIILTKTLVRLEIRGKMGRKVPMLIPPDLLTTLNLLVANRDRFVKNNPYLFSSTKCSKGFFRADRALKECAEASGAEYPANITSTKLRKHVATMIQLLNLKPQEFEGVAQFMGHDPKVHINFYRMQESTLQLAKISKLLLNMEKGNIKELTNKNLDEITLNDDILDESSDYERIEKTSEFQSNCPNKTFNNEDDSWPLKQVTREEFSQQLERCSNKQDDRYFEDVPKKKQRKSVIRRPWSQAEQDCVNKYFNMAIYQTQILPGKTKIESFLNKAGTTLNNRNWRDVKNFIWNAIKKQKIL